MIRLYSAQNTDTDDFLNYVFDCEKVDNRELFYGFNGKPYLKSGELYFNVSHSDGYYICAVSDREVGVDIQKVCYKPRVAKRICADNEPFPLNADDFTRLWALKESYIKSNGCGLEYGLSNVDTGSLKNAWAWRVNDFYLAFCYN